jgi:hypothetical protein
MLMCSLLSYESHERRPDWCLIPIYDGCETCVARLAITQNIDKNLCKSLECNKPPH